MIDGGELATQVRTFLRVLFSFPEGTPTPPTSAATFLQFGFGPSLKPGQANPKEFRIMAKGDVGERIPLVVTGLREDPADPGQFIPGEVEGEPRFEIADTSIAEEREYDGKPYAFLLAQGATAVTAFQSNPSGTELQMASLIVVNDPADDATILEFNLPDGEPVPA